MRLWHTVHALTVHIDASRVHRTAATDKIARWKHTHTPAGSLPVSPASYSLLYKCRHNVEEKKSKNERKDYTFRRYLHEKPGDVSGCPRHNVETDLL